MRNTQGDPREGGESSQMTNLVATFQAKIKH
jgi:hypothetical protein